MQGNGAPPPSQQPITSIEPGQGPQYNPSFGTDDPPGYNPSFPPDAPVTKPAPTPITPPTYPQSFPAGSGNYKPSPLGSALGAASVKGNYLKPMLGNVDARGAPYPMRSAAGGSTKPGEPNVSGVFDRLPDNIFDGSQSAQAPQSATPQGWNLFAALGQALSHLLGYNAQGQPQGMSGLIRNPVQGTPPTALRMPNAPIASRYQGRTFVG